MARPVCTPCPISQRGTITVTESSAPILTQPLRASCPSFTGSGVLLRSLEGAGSTAHPTTKAPTPPRPANNTVRLFMMGG